MIKKNVASYHDFKKYERIYVHDQNNVVDTNQ